MNYKNAKIYVIRNNCNDMVYVGGTIQSLRIRFTKHKSDCKRRTRSLYNAMNDLGIDKFYIELVEECPCDSKEQLYTKEGYYIREFDSYNNGYNERIEGRNKKDYRRDNSEKIKQYLQDNKEKIKEKRKIYYEQNKETRKQYRKQYNSIKFNCECGATIQKHNKARHIKSKKHQNYINNA